MFYNKSIILKDFAMVNKILKTYSIQNMDNSNIIYGDRYFMNHRMVGDTNVIRIWKTKSLFDIWYDEMRADNWIASIDYKIADDHLKIEYMNINDIECRLNNKYLLGNQESTEINKSMIEFVKHISKENKKDKIVVDVHNNLRIFDKYYKPEGFISTSRRCIDNPFWVEAELKVE